VGRTQGRAGGVRVWTRGVRTGLAWLGSSVAAPCGLAGGVRGSGGCENEWWGARSVGEAMMINQLMGCARNDARVCAGCVLHEAQGIGAGVLLGCLAGRAAIRSKIGIGIGNGVFGMRIVSWLAGCLGQGRQGMGGGCGRRVLEFHGLEITALQKATD
jgi:hypothetical protein